MENIYYTAIVFMRDTSKPPRKYRKIKKIESFKRFCETQQAAYINFYRKDNGLFVQRMYI